MKLAKGTVILFCSVATGSLLKNLHYLEKITTVMNESTMVEP